MKAADGSLDLMNWEVGIPGKAGVSTRSAFTGGESALLTFLCLGLPSL